MQPLAPPALAPVQPASPGRSGCGSASHGDPMRSTGGMSPRLSWWPACSVADRRLRWDSPWCGQHAVAIGPTASTGIPVAAAARQVQVNSSRGGKLAAEQPERVRRPPLPGGHAVQQDSASAKKYSRSHSGKLCLRVDSQSTAMNPCRGSEMRFQACRSLWASTAAKGAAGPAGRGRHRSTWAAPAYPAAAARGRASLGELPS
jgi:hypothetical protein